MVAHSGDVRDLKKILKEVIIQAAAGAHAINVFQVHGSVRIIDQLALITEVTTLTNCTNVHADLWDGTTAVPLTADGAVLSGAPVGTLLTKDKEAGEIYSLSLADQCRVNEVKGDEQIGRAFEATQKFGADTFIRLHLTTTDDPIDFKMLLKFTWEPVDSGYLEILI